MCVYFFVYTWHSIQISMKSSCSTSDSTLSNLTMEPRKYIFPQWIRPTKSWHFFPFSTLGNLIHTWEHILHIDDNFVVRPHGIVQFSVEMTRQQKHSYERCGFVFRNRDNLSDEIQTKANKIVVNLRLSEWGRKMIFWVECILEHSGGRGGRIFCTECGSLYEIPAHKNGISSTFLQFH